MTTLRSRGQGHKIT